MTGKLKYGLTDLRNERIGDLLVLQRTRVVKGKRPRWRCLCTACGSYITVHHNRLIDKNNPKTHCGCKNETGVTTVLKKEYHAWWDARERCHNPSHPSYDKYGAKGVTMCERWRDPQTGFAAFIEDIGEAPHPKQKYSLDRIDAFGHYEPSNVRWATLKQQARNKRGTKWVKHPTTGEPIKAAALAEELGIPYQQMRQQMIDKGEW